MNKVLYSSLVVASFLVFNSCDTPLSKYGPKNDAEKNIVVLLSTYLEARNNGDINTLTSLFNENGIYISGVSGTYTKSKIADSKPDWWMQYGTIELVNSKFAVSDNEATVTSTAKAGKGLSTVPFPHITKLVKENDEWLIMKIETSNLPAT